MRDELSDYEWSVIKPMLPNKPRGIPRVDDRRILNGIFWVLRSVGADLGFVIGVYTSLAKVRTSSPALSPDASVSVTASGRRVLDHLKLLRGKDRPCGNRATITEFRR